MLNRNNRQLFSDAIKLPYNSVVERIYGSTFTCSLDMIIGMLLWVDGNEKNYKELNPVEMLKSLFETSDKATIWYQRGYASLNGKANRLIELLDKVLCEVYIPESTFHPKFLLIKYKTPEDEKMIRYRFILLSRNFTMSDSWDVIFAIEGNNDNKTSLFGEQLSTFISQIDKGKHVKPTELDDIKKIKFELAGDICDVFSKEIEFNWQHPGNSRKLFSILPEKCTRSLVISPFLNKTFLYDIAKKTTGKVTVLSSQSALDGIIFNDDSDDKFSLWAFDGPQNGQSDMLGYATPDTDDDESVTTDTSVSLHSKIYFFEDDNKINKFMIGSANATANGWKGINSEALITFKSKDYTIDKFWKDSFTYSKNDKDLELPWIQKYTPGIAETNEEKDKLDAFHGILCSLVIKMKIDTEKSSYSIDIVNYDSVMKELEKYSYSVCIQNFYSFYTGENIEQLNKFAQGLVHYAYNDASLLSSFFYVYIMKGEQCKSSFILKGDVDWGNIDSEQRIKDIFKGIVSNASKFFALLRMLLAGFFIEDESDGGNGDSNTYKKSGSGSDDSFDPGFTFEELVWSLSGDRNKIDQIDKYINIYKDVSDNTEDPEILAFFDLWDKLKTHLAGKK